MEKLFGNETNSLERPEWITLLLGLFEEIRSENLKNENKES